MRRFTVLAVALLASACATAAETELDRMTTVHREGKARVSDCLAKARASAPYAVVGRYLPPLDGSAPSMSLRLNTDRPNAEQRSALVAFYNDQYRPCRDQALDTLQRQNPALAASAGEGIAASDAAYAQLAAGNVTWGQYADFSARLNAEQQSRVTATGQRIVAGLQSQHAQEVQQRQAASQALTNAGMGLIMLDQNQQMIQQQQQLNNTLARPVTTNCRYVGRNLTCTSF